MSEAWATVADLRSWAGPLLDEVTPADWTPDDLQGLLDRAQEDIRAYLRIPLDQLPGWIVTGGTGWQDPLGAIAANKAVCDQATYRLTVGEESLVEGTPMITSLPNVTFSPRPVDAIGPQAAPVPGRSPEPFPISVRHRRP